MVKARYRLSKLPETRLDTTRLAQIEQADVQRMINGEHMHELWRDDEQSLQKLNFPEQALGVNAGDRRALYALISALQPKSILEIGTHIGVSTAHIAMATTRYDNDDTPQIDTVDIVDVNVSSQALSMWKQYHAAQSPADSMALLGVAERVKFHQSDSLVFLSDSARTYDFIFLDGDHAASKVYQELPLAVSMLNDGGFILLHDYYPDLKPLFSDGEVICGPYLAVSRTRKTCPDLQLVPLGKLPWQTKLGSNNTSLALLGRFAR